MQSQTGRQRFTNRINKSAIAAVRRRQRTTRRIRRARNVSRKALAGERRIKRRPRQKHTRINRQCLAVVYISEINREHFHAGRAYAAVSSTDSVVAWHDRFKADHNHNPGHAFTAKNIIGIVRTIGSANKIRSTRRIKYLRRTRIKYLLTIGINSGDTFLCGFLVRPCCHSDQENAVLRKIPHLPSNRFRNTPALPRAKRFETPNRVRGVWRHLPQSQRYPKPH